MIRIRLFTLWAVMSYIGAACSAAPSPAAIQPTATIPQAEQTEATILDLSNAEYPIDAASTGKARLINGLFEEQSAPDSATKTKIWLGDAQTIGDLNGDGTDDAVALLIVDAGGSGTFTYLAAIINENGVAKPVASIFLGDRIIVKSLNIQSGEIEVNLLTRQPDEPMANEPTVELTQKFILENLQLKELK